MTDREKLVELLEDMRATCDVPENIDEDGCGTWSIEGGDYIADHLLAQGGTVREPGWWIAKPTGRYGQMQSWCSACNQRSGIGGIESNRHKPFCPNCGAKMDV